MSLKKLTEALENSMSYSELRIVVVAAVDVTNYTIEINDYEILILQSFTSLE